MNWTEKQIEYIILEMAQENTLACKALFSISRIRFTEEVPTMAVSLSDHPELLINMEFCRTHLQRESDVKAVLLHEFLHVILLHTEKYESNNPLLNIALDAIINAIIYRYKGMEYAELFVRLYKWEPVTMLLRPANNQSHTAQTHEWLNIHEAIYEGKYCADDLYELLQYLQSRGAGTNLKDIIFLGNHNREKISEEARALLDGIIKKMNGTKIWTKSKFAGVGDIVEREERKAQRHKINKWKKNTLSQLRKCLLPDKIDKAASASAKVILPLISSSDRRSLARFLHSGLIPFSANYIQKPVYSEKATIYLDVSGSMTFEIDRIVDLLHYFKSFIKMPIYVFSDDVYEARFRNGKLTYDTSFGTTMEPVFNHIRQNKIKKSMILTDGYVPPILDFHRRGINLNTTQILISSEGSPDQFAKAGFPYQQLKRL